MDFKEYVNILNSDIISLKGIGNKKASLFNKIGIFSIWDLLYNFPRTYDNRTMFYSVAELPENVACCINAVVASPVVEKRIKNKMSLYVLRIEDHTGSICVKWFSSPFNRHKLKRGEKYSFYGVVSSNRTSKEMILKDMEPCNQNERTGRIIPIYASTQGLSQNDFRKSIAFVFEKLEKIRETLPDKIIQKYNLISIGDALFQMHFPENEAALKKARYRFAFEELFVLCLAMRRIRSLNSVITTAVMKDTKCIADFAAKLPFELTGDQKKTINEICSDLKRNIPMNRLIQGDVGSGKTVVAACAAYAVVKNGYQVAVMAPTEILANQHYNTFVSFFENSEIKIALLTSSVKNKSALNDDIKNGLYDIVIGTHALIQDNVSFNNLGLCVTDEQHRFGVNQRAALADSHTNPHVLVMSATPIPRTLSLVVYGDLDISVISSVPKGRQKIDTFCIGESMRNRLNNFIKKLLTEGHQCFVVCPLIDASENIEANSGTEVYEYMQKYFPEFKVRFLHGKMTPDEKDEIMESFHLGKFQILVSTTVIEVGIDVPNATLMVVENAERFGLSQLHQLRGRVGRGNAKSYCILISEAKTEESKERMKIMCSTSDGFEVANYDLKLRGSGEFFGTRQHGLPELRVANLFTDLPIVESAKSACDEVLKEDPQLLNNEFSGLKVRIEKMFEDFENLRIFN